MINPRSTFNAAANEVSLPSGYWFSRNESDAAISAVVAICFPGDPCGSAVMANEREKFEVAGGQDIWVTVRSAQCIAGVGRLMVKGRHAELSELCVRPGADRGRGIGTAIIRRRIEIARNAGADSFYIDGIDDENKSGEYERFGFQSGPDEESLVLGPDPKSVYVELTDTYNRLTGSMS